jgi:hypothetical protein
MKARISIFNRRTTQILVLSFFVTIFAFNTSYAACDWNYSYVDSSGTRVSGFIPALVHCFQGDSSTPSGNNNIGNTNNTVSNPPIKGIPGLIFLFNDILGYLFPVLISLAVIYFLWQVFQYTVASNEDTKGKAKDQIVWGIVGLFVMVSIWGLVSILSHTFNLGNPAITPPPLTF